MDSFVQRSVVLLSDNFICTEVER